MSEERKSYYERATSWAVDEHASLRAALRQARLFALGALLIAVLEAFALLLLTPLKTVKAVPVLVDRETGYVEVLKDGGRPEIRTNDAMIRSLLAQYVIARESFDITDQAAEYRKVALWSAGAARQDYLALMPATNPQSPLHRYARSTIVDTHVRSVSPISPNVALVRFETLRHDQDGHAATRETWASTLAYRFVDAPMTVEDRLTNPLGFQVIRYHRDAEAAPVVEATPTPPPPPPAAQPAASVQTPVSVQASAPGSASMPNAPGMPLPPPGFSRPRP